MLIVFVLTLKKLSTRDLSPSPGQTVNEKSITNSRILCNDNVPTQTFLAVQYFLASKNTVATTHPSYTAVRLFLVPKN